MPSSKPVAPEAQASLWSTLELVKQAHAYLNSDREGGRISNKEQVRLLLKDARRQLEVLKAGSRPPASREPRCPKCDSGDKVKMGLQCLDSFNTNNAHVWHQEPDAAERAAFEKWAISEGYTVERNASGNYFSSGVEENWEGWQSRAALIRKEMDGRR